MLYHASLAAEATLKYANNNRQSCDISVPLLNQVERYHREAVQARHNACAGRAFRQLKSELGHLRRTETLPTVAACPLCPRKRQITVSLGMSA